MIDAKIQWAIARLMEKVSVKFHGSFTLTFKDGILQCVKIEETAKPPG
jgi:hypothetical protein